MLKGKALCADASVFMRTTIILNASLTTPLLECQPLNMPLEVSTIPLRVYRWNAHSARLLLFGYTRSGNFLLSLCKPVRRGVGSKASLSVSCLVLP